MLSEDKHRVCMSAQASEKDIRRAYMRLAKVRWRMWKAAAARGCILMDFVSGWPCWLLLIPCCMESRSGTPIVIRAMMLQRTSFSELHAPTRVRD